MIYHTFQWGRENPHLYFYESITLVTTMGIWVQGYNFASTSMLIHKRIYEIIKKIINELKL